MSCCFSYRKVKDHQDKIVHKIVRNTDTTRLYFRISDDNKSFNICIQVKGYCNGHYVDVLFTINSDNDMSICRDKITKQLKYRKITAQDIVLVEHYKQSNTLYF